MSLALQDLAEPRRHNGLGFEGPQQLLVGDVVEDSGKRHRRERGKDDTLSFLDDTLSFLDDTLSYWMTLCRTKKR